MKNKINYQKGANVLVIVGVIFVAIIIAALVFRFVVSPPAPKPEDQELKEPQPVYEVTVGNLKFHFEKAIDRSNSLPEAEGYFQWQKKEGLTTTERFVEVTIGVTNIGKENIDGREWSIEEVIDEEDRVFPPMNMRELEPWLPEDNKCDTLLKPGFTPSLCTKMYEVAEISNRLKIKVVSKEKKNEGEDFIDLFVVPEGEL